MSTDTNKLDNDHQKQVQGKKQHGPDDKVGRDAGGNRGSQGQNIKGDLTDDEKRDLGDERGSRRSDENQATQTTPDPEHKRNTM